MRECLFQILISYSVHDVYFIRESERGDLIPRPLAPCRKEDDQLIRVHHESPFGKLLCYREALIFSRSFFLCFSFSRNQWIWFCFRIFLAAFLRNFFLCQGHWQRDVPPHFAAALLCGSRVWALDYIQTWIKGWHTIPMLASLLFVALCGSEQYDYHLLCHPSGALWHSGQKKKYFAIPLPQKHVCFCEG